MSSYQSEFYMSISNTESLEYFPENTPSNFFVKLPCMVELNGDWVVGVNQIWMPKMWYNVRETDILIANEESIQQVTLQEGHYRDINQLVNYLNACMTINDTSYATFTYNDIKHKIMLKVKKNYNLAMPFELASLLGAERENFKGEVVFEKCPNIHIYDKTISVHMDIVEGHLSKYGVSTIVKLMDTGVIVFGDVLYEGVLTSYSKVTSERFDMIHVCARNKLGQVIKQEGGSSLIELHFKPC